MTHKQLSSTSGQLCQGHFTSLQIGWVTGPPHLITAIGKAHQFLTFCLPASLQTAVAHGLDNERSFFR